MSTRLCVILFILLRHTTVLWGADDAVYSKELDAFHFLAGLCTAGADMGYIDPPQCESFFRSGGEQRVAEIFLDAARIWSQRASSRAVTIHYYDPGGQRLVVGNAALSQALWEFYNRPERFSKRELAERKKQPWFLQVNRMKETDLTGLDSRKRLSFVAGIYARCCRDGEFSSRPSVAMRTTVVILRAEGCEVTKPRFGDGVPMTMHFAVKPSKEVARLFALVDGLKPPRVEWKEK